MDYCNGLLYGLPNNLVSKIQRVLNTAARLVTSTPRDAHITSVLRDLHWLRVSHMIMYKIALLTLKALHQLAPTYITELITPYEPTRSLRSSQKHLLQTPTFRLKTFGGRAFANAAPYVWNSLPDKLREATQLQPFKSGLKKHLFRDAFSN